MKTFTKDQLMTFNDYETLMKRIEKGFLDYSHAKVDIPPVCHMHFQNPPGDLHIKCAAKSQDDFFVVKIASNFPENSKKGKPSIEGMMLLFCQKTGEPKAHFMDNGYLTHLRTAIAGAICAKYLAPQYIQSIGLIGSGAQARFQLQCLRLVTTCREAWVWSPRKEEMMRFQQDASLKDFKIHCADTPQEVAQHCRLIVTTTPASSPLLFAQDIQAGTHITAVGSDRPGKQELDPMILNKAHRVVVDSRNQCFKYGETYCAIQARQLSKEPVVEIGEIVAGSKAGRQGAEEITVSDLTGLGIQDLEIALAFYEFLQQ
jgi:ornithine cyclodeaminase